MEFSAFASDLSTVFEHMPLGVCNAGDWLLHYANNAMRHLLEIDNSMPSQGLTVWLRQGTLAGYPGMSGEGGPVLESITLALEMRS